jgi:hypothetical protein
MSYSKESDETRVLIHKTDENKRPASSVSFSAVAKAVTAIAAVSTGVLAFKQPQDVSFLGAQQFKSFDGSRVVPSNFIDAKPNLVYIKIPKTGSTTMALIARKIAVQHGISNAYSRNWINQEPGVWWNHEKYADLIGEGKLSGLTKPTFTWTILRDPVTRIISNFQYTVMYNGKNTNDPDGVYAYCKASTGNRACQLARSEIPSDYEGIYNLLLTFVEDNKLSEIGYSSLSGLSNATLASDVKLDFVGVTERYTESVLIMAEMLGLSFSDMLFQPAKSAEYDWGNDGPEELSESAYQKVASMMKEKFGHDFEYLDMANKKMDELKGGIINYQSKLKEYEYHLGMAQKKCPLTKKEGNVHFTDAEFDANQKCFDEYAKSIQLVSWGDAGAEFLPPFDSTAEMFSLPVEQSSGPGTNRFELD